MRGEPLVYVNGFGTLSGCSVRESCQRRGSHRLRCHGIGSQIIWWLRWQTKRDRCTEQQNQQQQALYLKKAQLGSKSSCHTISIKQSTSHRNYAEHLGNLTTTLLFRHFCRNTPLGLRPIPYSCFRVYSIVPKVSHDICIPVLFRR